MRRLLLLAVAVVLGLVLPRPAGAITFTVTGSVVEASYTEPTTNADAALSPLTDLAHTNVYHQVPGQSPVKAPNVPATALTGGGAIVTTVTVPIVAGQQADVTFWATATDTSGNESARSTEFIRRIDRLPPGPPN